MANYKCNQCDSIFELNTVTTIEGIFLAKYFPRKKIKAACSCLSEDIQYESINFDPTSIQVGKFSMMSIEEKKQSLKNRSSAHFKAKIKEKKIDMHKNYE